MLVQQTFKEGEVVVFTEDVPQMAGSVATVVTQYDNNEVTSVKGEDGRLYEVFTECLRPRALR